VEKMPNYKEKLTNIISDQEFVEGMGKGKFAKTPKHQGLNVFLYYTAARLSEGLNMKREQFRLRSNVLFVDIGIRLKHSKTTPPLEIPLNVPYAEYLVDSVLETSKGEKVFPYCRKTGYNIVNRVFSYPHHYRLSRITWFFLQGFTIAQVKSWTGLTLKALDYYIGLVSITEMGQRLAKKVG